LLLTSCDNKYKTDQEKSEPEKKEKTVKIDGEEYKISGEIDINVQDEN